MILELSADDAADICNLADALARHYSSVETGTFADECAVTHGDLPKAVRQALYPLRSLRQDRGYLLIRGIPLEDEAIGPSPSTWDAPWGDVPYKRQEIIQCLLTSSLGEIFGWRTQENGRYLRHIVPMEKDKHEQLGTSSAVDLLWHTEEAFHPCRADYISIMCYRNSERAVTHLACVEDLSLDEATVSVLHERRFYIEPDKSHFPENNESQHWGVENDRFAHVYEMFKNPRPVPALVEEGGVTTFCVDQAFMRAAEGDVEAELALDALYKGLDDCKLELVLRPGDLLIVDNHRTAHGRSVYDPDYGPKQRWLRRVNVMADLRKSLAFRQDATSRVLV
ncbi:TauD/TfdA family dioxygenase [Arenibaculum sp.]|jgi:Fe(II)/alpha-ketoglutarate-dependent arginine beta-hydroxylase|uniref:TauD/TfdA family dioxygenase n=1 Tax=Arenibaculum sp. TaxID=2865862 RepID=UPI002E15C575|nr:TauD/TfdA family dioxygenase [Arenibaculum sp.]